MSNINKGGIKIFKGIKIGIFAILLILIFTGCAAADNSSQTNLTNSLINSTSNFNISNETNSTNATESVTYSNDCCSILLHVNEGYDVFSYRRDSNYAADLYFQHLNWYGKDIIKEYKVVNGYFFHTIISGDGWIVATGGPDVPDLNMALENLAGGAFLSGGITGATIDSATSILRQLGMGHFIIKAPNDDVGLSIYNGGSTKTALFKIGNGQYVSVPNGPGYYREGYTSTYDAVSSAINLAITDGWGVNRRNIITYEVIDDVTNYSTLLKIWASSTRSSDNMVFEGQVISGSSLPTAPDRKFIGQIALKSSDIYMGYRSLIYMYSQILDSYSVNGALPGGETIMPWKILSDPSAGPFTNDYVVNASIWVKNYIEVNHQLPGTVIVNGQSISIYKYLYLVSTVVQNINSNNSKLTYAIPIEVPQSTREDIHAGNMGLNEYLKIADQIKVYMDKTGIMPGYAYRTSLGDYFGWQSMVYMYSNILASYNATRALPNNIAVKPWKIVTDPNVVTASNSQIIDAAFTVKNYIDTNYNLPDNVTVNGKQIGMYSFLYLLSFAVQNIYNHNNSTMDTWSFNGPEIQKEDIHTGNMGISEYIHIADIAKVYMDKTNYVPGYAYGTSLGTYFGWKSMIYTYSNILASYNTTKTLPSIVGVKPWKIISDPNIVSATNLQVVDAALWAKNYIESNQKLPDYVTVNGKPIGMYSFLYLLSFAVQNIYNHNNGTMDTWTFKGPEIEKEEIHAGNMSLSEYIHIADVVKVYMDKTGYVPGYAYKTGLGTYFGWQSMIYMYSQIFDSYNSKGILPVSIAVKLFGVAGGDVNAAGGNIAYTREKVINASIWVKNYIEVNHKLPDSVNINGNSLGMYSFLYLLSFAVQNIYNHNNSTMDTWSFNNPEIEKEDIHTGNMGISEYIHIADVVKVYMDKTGIVPGYAYGTSLGTYFGWKSMIYTYSNILASYNATNSLPNIILVKPWKIVSDPNAVSATNGQIITAAKWVKNYIETNHNLPDTVSVNGQNVNIYTYFYLASTAVQNIYNKNNVDIYATVFKGPQLTKENIRIGSMDKAKYIKIADQIKVYMDNTGITPGYAVL